MLNDLEAYLEASTTPELRDLILDACEVLTNAGVDNHLFLLRNVMGEAENGDFDLVYGGIVGTLVPLLRHNLGEFGIKLVEEVELPVLVSMFEALNTIEDWDDPDTLNALSEAPEGNEEALADILEVVGDMTSSDYLMVLESVSEDLMKRIGEITTRYNAGPQPAVELVERARKRLRELFDKDHYGEDSLFVQRLVDGLRLGLDFHPTVEPLLPQIAELEPDAMARELVALAYASSLPTEEVLPALNQLKESFTLSITDLIRLDGEIKRLL